MVDLSRNLSALQQLAYRKKFWRLEFFKAYPKQLEFFAHSKTKRERLLMAANQVGKTYAGAGEVTNHLTGRYPDWWPGRVWRRPVRMWAAGESSLLVRDVQQKLLCGEPGVEVALGTGMIPKDLFADKPSLARGVTDAYDTVQITHSNPEVKKGNYIQTPCNDGVSILKFKSYEQGRLKFQGETIDGFWGDEEPPMEIYSEMLTRITATKGMGFITFTPLKGMSDVVIRFLNEKSDDRSVTTMMIEDAEHIAPEERAKIIAGYPAHEREARSKGIPMLGSGKVFQVSEEAITEPALQHVPEHWVKIWGVDFGIGHPFGAVLLLWDKDADCIHVHAAIRMVDEGQGSLPIHHAKAMKAIGAEVPVAWPQDGTAREKSSGHTVADAYKKEGLRMLPDHATWEDGGISTEAGIIELTDRMTSGRFKVAAHLSQWFEEFRMYHRKDGQIVKVRDDLMSATRVGVMMKRFAKWVQLGSHQKSRRRVQRYAEGSDPFRWGEDPA